MNNAALYDSALVAIASSNGAWISNPAPAHYAGELSAAQAIATEIDSRIPTIATGATISQRQLLESIVKSVMIGRTPEATVSYVEIANAVAAVFTEYATNLQDSDVGSYVLSVPTFAVLISLAGAVVGQKVRVESVGRSFEFTPPGTSPLQNAVVMNGIGGQWHSLEGTSDQKWLAQTTWFIDGTNGNDENVGTDIAHPIKTGLELSRRFNGPAIYLDHVVTVTILTDIEIIELDLTTSSTGQLRVIGVPTIILDTTVPVGGYVAESDAACASITLNGVADMSVYKYQRLRAPNSNNTISWVSKWNNPPERPGVQFARISKPQRVDGTGLHTGNFPDDTQVLIEALPKVANFSVSLAGAQLAINTGQIDLGQLYVDSLDIGTLTTIGPTINASGNSVYSSKLSRVKVSDTATSTATISILGCCVLDPSPLVSYSVACLWATLGTESFLFTNVRMWILGHELFEYSVFVGNNTIVRQQSRSFIYSTAASIALFIYFSSSWLCEVDKLCGRADSFALFLYPNATLRYPAGKLPALTGTAGDVMLSPTFFTMTWAQAALWNDGQRSGFTTLVGGVKDVPIPIWDTTKQQVQLTVRDIIGVAGHISAPFAARTPTNLRVQSDNAGDNSTVEWSLTPWGYNQVIGLL